jgi:3-phenylpropionate/cinnamic acid dioxygenase small subunit
MTGAIMSSELLDRQHIVDLVTSVGRCLDERDFEALRDLFTGDATIATPGGTVSGHDALVAQARRGHSRDKGIQHVITNHLVEIDGDRASVRANLLVAFAASGPDDPQPFLLGEVYRFELRRSADGWRISSLSSTPVWSLNRTTRLAGLPSPA